MGVKEEQKLLVLILEMKSAISAGIAPQEAVQKNLMQDQSTWSEKLLQEIFYIRKNQKLSEDRKFILNERVFLDILAQAQKGVPILKQLESLELEVRQSYDEHLDRALVQLPYMMMFPILIGQFIPLMILFLGPILASFLEVMQ